MASTNAPRPPSRARRARCALAVLLLVAGGREGARAAAAPADATTFFRYRYIDPQSGLEAFHLLVPKGWRVEGAITWSADPALPARLRFRFHDPEQGTEFDIFPTQAHFWTDNRLFLATNPPGTPRFGTLVAAPVDAHAALDRVIAAGRRGVAGLAVVREAPVPELAELARGQPAQGVRASAEAAKRRIRYLDAGRPMEEEVYAAVSHFVTDLPGSGFSPGYFIDYWFIDHVFSFRAEQGKLDSHRKTFQTMIYSLQANPRWFAKVVHVKEALAQQAIRGIHATGRLGETIARAGSELRQDQLRDWERRQEVQDRVARNFSDHIRGVDRFQDPLAGREVELPSGYGRAWANDNGEYVVTDSPSFDPNVDSNLHWVPLQPVR